MNFFLILAKYQARCDASKERKKSQIDWGRRILELRQLITLSKLWPPAGAAVRLPMRLMQNKILLIDYYYLLLYWSRRFYFNFIDIVNWLLFFISAADSEHSGQWAQPHADIHELTQGAWDQVQQQRQQRTYCIRGRLDASNKPDPTDSKCHNEHTR